MPISLQVLYPAKEGSRFDHEYYENTHLPLMQEHMGDYILSTFVSKGISGGPDSPPGFHAIATAIFEDHDSLKNAMASGRPVLADIPNYTDVEPQILIGEIVG